MWAMIELDLLHGRGWSVVAVAKYEWSLSESEDPDMLRVVRCDSGVRIGQSWDITQDEEVSA
jgi:hypothetical protein